MKLLLHACCGPCLSGSFEKVKDDFAVTTLWYNPNIEPQAEHDKRKENYLKYVYQNNIRERSFEYDYITENQLWHDFIKGLENEPEGGERCEKCFEFRLNKVLEFTKDFDLFTTTLSISPYKNAGKINEIGKEFSPKFLEKNFSEDEGYKRSIELSKQYDLYRQKYCGCRYSSKG